MTGRKFYHTRRKSSTNRISPPAIFDPMRNIVVILFLTGSIALSGQNNDYIHHNYTIEDGLPSNECHNILQDSLGYIWIATDRGLVRYDGYTFKTYGAAQGLKNISCLAMVFDKNENIYINTNGAQVYIYDRNIDSIYLFPFQSEINKHRYADWLIEDLYIDSLNNSYFNIFSLGIIKVEPDGKSIVINHDVSTRSYFIHQVEDKLFSCFQNWYANKIISDKYFTHSGKTKVAYDIIFNDRYKLTFESTNFSFLSSALWLDDSTSVISNSGKHYIMRNKKEIQRTRDGPISEIVRSSNGLFTAFAYPDGLRKYESTKGFINDRYVQLIEYIYATDVIEDNNQNLWVSSLNHGIFYLEKSPFKKINNLSGITGSVSAMDMGPDDQIYVITDNSKVWKCDLNTTETKIIYEDRSDRGRVYDIYYSRSAEGLFVAGHKSKFIKEGHPVIDIKSTFEGYLFDLNALTISKPKYRPLHLISPSYYYVIDEGRISENHVFESVRFEKRFNDLLYDDQGDTILATQKGVGVFENQDIRYFDHIPPLVDQRVNCLNRINQYFIAGTNGIGAVIWSRDSTYLTLDESNGLCANSIESTFIDSNGRLFLLSKQGFSVLDTTYLHQKRIRSFDTSSGLPSSSVIDIREYNGSYLIATEKGIVSWKGQVKSEKMKAPLIEAIYVNDRVDMSLDYSHDQSDIHIRYRTIDHRAKGNIQYRYRLDQNQWRNTMSTDVHLANLYHGDYQFSVQTKITGSEWSNPKVIHFTIHPPLWKSSWFRAFLILLALSIIYKLYAWRSGRLKDAFRIKQEISNLEKSALQAQMNPHFIFNCLNSIQNFIMENDKINAMDYLSRFAKLIRLNLNASVEGKVSIEQEVSMLDNYLALEKLRFKDKFDYHIHVDPQVHISSTFIPPLLIQPYVENAIIHGLKNVEEGGKVVVSIYRINDALNVDISDNGSGMSIDKIRSAKKSLGMSITQKRIEHNNKNDRIDLNISSNKDGVTVKLTIIPLNESQTL